MSRRWGPCPAPYVLIIDARRSRAIIRLLTVAAWLTMMGVVAIPSVGFGEANDPKERDALARGSISEPAREAEALGPALWLAVVGGGGVANTRRHKSE